MLPGTFKRVEQNTTSEVNARIQRDISARVESLSRQDREAINARLRELRQEWDIERVLETNAATAVILGSLLTATVSRKWAVLPLAVGGFLLQHALQGWCPPLPVFRRLGVRTAEEIHQERMALKALRGDFRPVDARKSGEPLSASAALSAAIR